MSSTSTAGESIAYRVIIPSVLGPVVALPLCGIRMYTKLYILRNTGYDDCKQSTCLDYRGQCLQYD